jgi:hypothetical protein
MGRPSTGGTIQVPEECEAGEWTEERGHRFTRRNTPDSGTIRGDTDQVEQLVGDTDGHLLGCSRDDDGLGKSIVRFIRFYNLESAVHHQRQGVGPWQQLAQLKVLKKGKKTDSKGGLKKKEKTSSPSTRRVLSKRTSVGAGPLFRIA